MGLVTNDTEVPLIIIRDYLRGVKVKISIWITITQSLTRLEKRKWRLHVMTFLAMWGPQSLCCVLVSCSVQLFLIIDVLFSPEPYLNLLLSLVLCSVLSWHPGGFLWPSLVSSLCSVYFLGFLPFVCLLFTCFCNKVLPAVSWTCLVDITAFWILISFGLDCFLILLDSLLDAQGKETLT